MSMEFVWSHARMQRRLGQREIGGRLQLHADTRKRPEENAANDMSVAASIGQVPFPTRAAIKVSPAAERM